MVWILLGGPSDITNPPQPASVLTSTSTVPVPLDPHVDGSLRQVETPVRDRPRFLQVLERIFNTWRPRIVYSGLVNARLNRLATDDAEEAGSGWQLPTEDEIRQRAYEIHLERERQC